jgi:hypothetical protein
MFPAICREIFKTPILMPTSINKLRDNNNNIRSCFGLVHFFLAQVDGKEYSKFTLWVS